MVQAGDEQDGIKEKRLNRLFRRYLKQERVSACNNLRVKNPSWEPDLGRIYLERLDLTGINLAGAFLGQSEFFDVLLAKANLAGADLTGAKLGCNFRKADLTDAVLVRADLRGASMREAKLVGTDCSGADFSNTDLCGADVSCADFSRAKTTDAQLERTLTDELTVGLKVACTD